MLRKLLLAAGLCGALLAAEALNRVSSLVSALNGPDAPFYSGALIASVIAAGALLLSLFQSIPSWVKWLVFLALAGSTVVIGAAPALPVNQQAIAGLVLALIGVLFV